MSRNIMNNFSKLLSTNSGLIKQERFQLFQQVEVAMFIEDENVQNPFNDNKDDI